MVPQQRQRISLKVRVGEAGLLLVFELTMVAAERRPGLATDAGFALVRLADRLQRFQPPAVKRSSASAGPC